MKLIDVLQGRLRWYFREVGGLNYIIVIKYGSLFFCLEWLWVEGLMGVVVGGQGVGGYLIICWMIFWQCSLLV